MTKPPPPALITKDFAGDSDVGAPITGGLWTLHDDRLTCIDAFTPGPAIVLVPGEQVLILAVPLPPLGSAMRRREALPFAIEDRIAQPLDDVHVALGAQHAPGVWLAGIVSHAVMRGWTARLDAAGLSRAIVAPDALALPVPEAGWSVDVADSRAIVRASDGTGFALPLAQFDAAWRASGEPEHHAAMRTALLAPALDLRQGVYAPPRRPLDPLWRRIALIAGIGALAHGVIAIADTAALTHLAHVRDAQVRTLASGLQPPVLVSADIGDTLNALAPDGAATGPSRFLSLLSRSATAIAVGQSALQNSGQNSVLWRSVAFDRTAGTLTIEAEAGDIADLQRTAQALTRAGLSVQPGAATSESGHAVGSFVIRAP